MTAVLIIATMAFANRVRGGLFGESPGVRWLFIVSAIMALALWPLTGLAASIAWGLAFTAWGVRGWGRWYDLGRLPENYARPGPPEKWSFEWCIEKLVNLAPEWPHRDHWCLLLRHLLIVPALVLPAYLTGSWYLVWLGFPAALLIVLCYEIGWQMYERGWTRGPTGVGEWLTGAVWGALIYSGVAL